MMEQMLKLCMFLMRAKLTITEAAGGGGVGVVWMCSRLWALHLCSVGMSRVKKQQIGKEETKSVHQ